MDKWRFVIVLMIISKFIDNLQDLSFQRIVVESVDAAGDNKA